MPDAPGPPPARVALVTGAGRGIGRAVASGLAGAGLSVGLLGRTPEPLAEVAASVRAAGGRAADVVADVTDWSGVRSAVDAVERRLGPVDLLVNSAGAIDAVEVPVWEADPEEWWRVVETDLRGPFHCVRAVVPGMVARGGGRVVDLNSGSGTRDMPVYSAYNVAKTGLFRVGGGLHAAGYDLGLRAFEVSPGVVDTAMTRGMAVHADRTDWTAPEHVVELVVAVARGELDAWSGRFLRAGADDVAELRRVAADGAPPGRTLGVLPYGPGDPLDGPGHGASR
ncbi:MAG TPA: SDR family oxidoreductase [Jiangellales bacterium]|nr:SDR family oxidoreductase [Jiangellales bacterium]